MEKQRNPETSLLGIMQLVLFQEDLLPRLEGGHPQVWAAGAAERVPQVALARERKAPSSIRGGFWFSPAATHFFQLGRQYAPQRLPAQKPLPFQLCSTCLVSAVRAVLGTGLTSRMLGMGSPGTTTRPP